MSKQERIITHNSPFEMFFANLTNTYFKQDIVKTYLEEKQPSCNYQGLCTFLKSRIVQGRLSRQWNYERKWKNRSIDMAIRETLLHGLAAINEEAELFLNKGFYKYFPGLSEDQVISIHNKSKILYCYFSQTLPEPPSYSNYN